MYYNLIPLMNKTTAFLPAAQTYFDQVVTNGGSLTNNEKTYINTFIGALGTDFTEFDRLWIHGLGNSVAARTSLANPTSTMITAVNSPTFTANQGYNGNGTSYLNSNYNPVTNGVKFTQNNASMFIYSLTNLSNVSFDIGQTSATTKSFLITRYTDGNSYYPLNVNSGLGSPGGAVANSLSLYSIIRTASNLQRLYKAGALVVTSTTTSAALINNNIFMCAYNATGTASSFSTRKYSASGFGSGIINQTTFYTALQALGTSIGWAV